MKNQVRYCFIIAHSENNLLAENTGSFLLDKLLSIQKASVIEFGKIIVESEDASISTAE
jgi:hypothetical protein